MRTRVVSVALLAIVMCAAAAPAAAQGGSQPKPPQPDTMAMTVSGGYAYLREAGTDTRPPNIYDKGWVVWYAQRILTSRIVAVGEVGGSYRLDAFDERQKLHAFFGGVRYPIIRLWRFSTFAQALVGAEYFSAPGYAEHGLAFQPGAGVDLRLTRRISLRAQGDFRIANENQVNFKEGRFAATAVVGIR